VPGFRLIVRSESEAVGAVKSPPDRRLAAARDAIWAMRS